MHVLCIMFEYYVLCRLFVLPTTRRSERSEFFLISSSTLPRPRLTQTPRAGNNGQAAVKLSRHDMPVTTSHWKLAGFLDFGLQ